MSITTTVVLSWLAWAPPNAGEATPSASHIAGGPDALLCQFPATAAVLNDGSQFCSASLVHPRVVLLAAHCLLPGFGADAEEIQFGEDVEAPARTVQVDECGYHPDFQLSVEFSGIDVAYCTLSEEVNDVPIVPPLMGCERDALGPGTPLTIVGFGSDEGVKIDDVWVEFSGSGIKRYGDQVVDQIVDDGVWMLGDGVSACPGDSGGPAMMQLADGTWRVVGSASTNHPDAPQDGGQTCGYGSVYSTFASVMPWIEEQSGYDVTPCHDADGTWNPSVRCDAFPLAPEDAALSSLDWADGCATTERSGPGESCGAAFGSGGGTTGSDDGGLDDSTGGDTGQSTGNHETGETGTAPDGSTSDSLDDTGGTSDTGGTGGADGEPGLDGAEPSSCSCTTPKQAPGTTAPLLMLALLASRRRRTAH